MARLLFPQNDHEPSSRPFPKVVAAAPPTGTGEAAPEGYAGGAPVKNKRTRWPGRQEGVAAAGYGAVMNEYNRRDFLDQTLRSLRKAWRGIAGAGGYDAEAASMRPELPDEDVARLREQMRSCLETRGGEVSARARAAALGRAYLALDATGRRRFRLRH